MIKVPFNDLKSQWLTINNKIKNDVLSIIDNCQFTGRTDTIIEIENKIKKLHHIDNVILVSSGTDALFLLLAAHNIGNGDEVIIQSNTFIAAAFAISRTGAKPVFCDVNENGLINFEKIKSHINKNTKAIIITHLYGQAVDINEIKSNTKNILIIEDGAQSIGNEFASMGKDSDGAIISFYCGKNIGVAGNGGCVLINNSNISDKIRKLANQGQESKYNHVFIGGNYRFDNINSPFLFHGLDYLDSWNRRRREIGKLYNKIILDKYQFNLDMNKNTFHVYPILLPYNIDREFFMNKLNQEYGIETSIHYPIPIHKSKAYYAYNAIQNKVSEDLCSRIISLPIFVTMTDEQVEFVSKTINIL